MSTERQTMSGKPVFTVAAKTVINFKSHFDKKLLCDGMTFSTGEACNYSCSFCYVPSMMRKREPWLKERGVEGEHVGRVVRRENPIEIARKQILSKSAAFINSEQVIYASPLVDVAGNMELVRETIEMCKLILEMTDWHIRLLSKSNLLPLVAKPLRDWDGKARVIYGVSTGTLDDKLAAAFEQGTAKVSKRIESLHWLQDNGFRTFGMICPSLPSPKNQYMEFAYQMAKAIRAEKCEHVWAEVINVRGDSMTRTCDALEDAGYGQHAQALHHVSTDKEAWEQYARDTFRAHATYIPPEKLRFLQYVNNANRAFWTDNEKKGAVLL